MTRVRPLLRALPVLALAWVLLALPSNASADCSDTPSGPGCATVTIAPPPMGGTLQGTPPRFVYGQVTADPQPTFGVQVSGWQPGDTLQCGIGTEADLGTCGPPLPGCAAEVCASYQPPAPLSGTGEQSVHDFIAEVRDAEGFYAGSAEFDFAVDATPPDTVLDAGPGDSVWHPDFDVNWRDDSPYGTDVVQCSLVPYGRAPSWQPCPGDDAGWSRAIPHKRADYQFQARAVDVLGRPDPSPAAVDFNPIPCQIRARRVSIGQLVRTGLPVSLDCHFADAVSVFVNSAPCGVYSCVGVRHFTGSTSRIWKVRARFRVQRRYVRALKAGRQVRIDVVVEPNAYGEPSVEKLTLH
ncbi:MAG TPA: hypothetical protein VJ741_04620 [Solirubrobacteraceae bacterium]|nr:hypothetical protein [Solirubrobacteraceae bacterium]